MQLENLRIIFIAIGLIGILLFASPTIGLLLKPPTGEKFSSLYILGSNRTFDYIPFNIKADVTYLVYLGIGNNIGSPCYYTCFAKIGNDTRLLPNATIEAPSPLPALYEYKSFISDGSTWESPLTFRVNQLTFNNNVSEISILTINGIPLPVNQISRWDSTRAGYYYNLFVELWVYNSTLGTNQYNNRFVSLLLNMTQ